MSQHDQNIANADGATVRADINNALGALVSNSSGASAPATTFAYMWWADTTNDLLKRRNSANSAWISLCSLSGGQIVFPATQNPSADPNIFDDYFEGAWVPTDGSGAGLALTLVDCRRTKLGRVVILSGSVTYPVTADSSPAKITLPYAAGGLASGTVASDVGTFVQCQASGAYLFFQDVATTGKTNAQLSGKTNIVSIVYTV